MEVTRFEKEAETDRKRARGKWADVGGMLLSGLGGRGGVVPVVVRAMRLCLGAGVVGFFFLGVRGRVVFQSNSSSGGSCGRFHCIHQRICGSNREAAEGKMGKDLEAIAKSRVIIVASSRIF